MKPMKLFSLSLAFLTLASIAHEPDFTVMDRSGLALYRWFEVAGVFSFELSDEDANAIVAHAIESQDPEFVRHAVMGMTWHAQVIDGSYEFFFKRKWQDVVPWRTFNRVPGLKDYLIDYYREGRFPEEPDIEVELTLYNGTGWVNLPAWKAAPIVLATYFPNDPNVHDFIFETHEDDQAQQTLILLSAGKFRTKKADRFRIECLNRDWPPRLRQFAAKALGDFQTADGLRALKNALRADHSALNEVTKAILAFDASERPNEALHAFVELEQENPRPMVQQAVQEIIEHVQF